MEKIYKIFGFRKTGGIDKSDDRDFKAEELIKFGDERESIDLDAVNYQDQGRTPHCVAFAWAHFCSIVLTAKYHKKITVEGTYVASLMIKDGLLGKNGAYIVDGCKTILKYGVRDTEGNLYRFESYAKVLRGDIAKTLTERIPVVCGTIVGRPVADENWVQRIIRSVDGGGHCMCFVGFTPLYLIWKNSWYKWGIKWKGTPVGRMYYPLDQINKLMTPYILINPQLVSE